jgi:two-component system chemotaxis sensor kinase CheA
MSTADDDFIIELQKGFLEEVSFLLEQCEESYLKLDKVECRVEELGKIFRLAHSMKGTGAAVGFHDLAAFAHVVEDCLSLLRTYPELVDISVVSLLLRAGDAFKDRIAALKQNDATPWKIEELKAEVKAQIAEFERRVGAPTKAPVILTPEPLLKNELVQPRLTEAEEDELKWKEMAAVAASTLPANEVAAPPAQAKEPLLNQAPAIEAKTQPAKIQKENGSIKIDTDRVENVLNLVGELVVIKSQLITQCAEHGNDLKLGTIVSLMDKTIRELQDKTLSMRMTPLKSLFLKTQRLIRDLSVKLNKPIDFQMSGEDTEIDRTMVELLGDPLMHMARNSLDHGIENPEIRKSKNKAEKGSIFLTAKQTAGKVVIEIKDDGAGLNRPKIFKKAQEKGLISPDVSITSFTDKQMFQLIFAPGFSSADQVSDLSGRGVGMDVVKTNIEKLKGVIDIETKEGQGATLIITIPLTTSITDGMISSVSGELYILPMDSIRELVKLDPKTLIDMNRGQKVFNHRGKSIPVIDLAALLSRGQETVPDEGHMLALVETRERIIGLQLGQVLGQTQVVLKPLGDKFEAVKGVSGAAILGDGRVGLVLDPQGLLDYFISTSDALYKRELDGTL